MPSKYTGKTRAEVRSMVLANNKGKPASDKSRQDMTYELKLWSAQNKSSEKTTTSTKAKKEETTKGYSNYGEGNRVNSELARDETYSDYAAEIRGDAPAEDLYKKSGTPKRSTFKMKGWSGFQK